MCTLLILCHTNHIPKSFGEDRQSPYHSWASSHTSHKTDFVLFITMIQLNPRLVHLRAFGTDGESELIKAFHTCFLHAVHLRCMNHLCQNIKEKLHGLKIQNVWKDLSDILRVQIGTHFERGLVDSHSPVFQHNDPQRTLEQSGEKL